MLDKDHFLKVIIELKKRNRIIGQKLRHLSVLQADLDKKLTTQNSLTDWVYTPPNLDELKQTTEKMLEANDKVLEYKQRINYSEIKFKQKENGETIIKLREALKNVHSTSN